MMDPRTKGHNPERLSLLKGGIVYSSAVTTVSPGYAAELMSGGSAGWMKDTLVANKSKVRSSTPAFDSQSTMRASDHNHMPELVRSD